MHVEKDLIFFNSNLLFEQIVYKKLDQLTMKLFHV